MFRRLFTVFIFIFLGMQMAFSSEVFKITSINLDTSNSLILLSSSMSQVQSEMNNVKIGVLSNPKRLYFDLKGATLNIGPQNWYFNSKDIKQVKISQFNPETVRVVLYTSDNFDKSKISLIKSDKTLIIQLKDVVCETDYFQQVYTDEKTSSGKYYENLSISDTDINAIKSAESAIESQDIMKQVQNAFSGQTVVQKKPIIKNLKLKTGYYITSLTMNNNGILLSGVGEVTLEKPMILSNPKRIVFDIPNSITAYNILNKTKTVGGVSFRVGQFSTSKSRLVITSENVDYSPVYSPDGQSVLFINNSSMPTQKRNNAVRYYKDKSNFIISFDAPVVHGIKRTSEGVVVNLYNTYSFNEKDFNEAIAQSPFRQMKVSLLPKVGLSLSLPLEKNAVFNGYLGADGKAIKLSLKNVQTKIEKPKPNIPEKPLKFKGKAIVIVDAGHGGHDYGAMREGVNEKDINLDIATMVAQNLTKSGVNVVMTRDSDEFISLPDRVSICSNNNADLFVSVHVNASVKPEINGIETHYYNQNSLSFANTVHECIINRVAKKDRGVFKSKFYVINHTEVPAILVEVGFISNETERNELAAKDRKQATAKAISEGIIKYLNLK